MIYFNNAYYACGDSGAIKPRVYRSFNANPGTWSEYTMITPYFQNGSEDAVSRMAVDVTGTTLFMGTANYSGGMQTPQVYRSTSTFTNEMYGTIPYSQTPSMYQDISAIEFFSATGGNDSIFVFVSSWSGMEIWKTKASTTSPTWIKALSMPGSTSIVTEVVKHNNQLFAATCGDSNGGFILHSTNGITWDTLGYGGLGQGSNHFSVKSLCVYNGELYAGTKNTTSGAGVFKSSDNGVTWTPVDISYLGFGTQLESVSDLKVKGDWLFASFILNNATNMQATIGYMLPTGGFKTSTNGTYLQNHNLFTYFGGEVRLWPFPNNFYMYVLANSTTTHGAMLKLPLPYAHVMYNTSGICQGADFEVTGGATTNANTYEWFIDGVSVSTSKYDTFPCPAIGSFDYVFKAYNGGIYDSVYIQVDVVPQQTGTVTANPGFAVCPGQPVTLSFNQASGNPYYAKWTTISGTPDSTEGFTASFIPSPTTATTYSLYLYDTYSCEYDTTFTVNTNTATDILGNISYTGGPVNNGSVYILKYQPTFAGTDTLAILPISAGGSYSLPAALYGNYLIKADPDITIPAYANTMSTYNGGAFRWDSAAPFLHSCLQNDTVNIQLLELPPQTGTAKVSGHITEGAGYGMRLLNGGHNHIFAPGGPLKGIDVKLGKNPGGGIQARTMSDTTGYYEFDSVPPGGYKIYVDIPNLPMDSTRTITIDLTTDSIINNDYKADSMMVYIDLPPVGIKNNTIANENKIKVFPNPANDYITIEYDLKTDALVRTELVDILGKSVAPAVIEKETKGTHQQTIQVVELPAGVYFVKLTANGNIYSFKLTVTK